jgi:hypothetical protein
VRGNRYLCGIRLNLADQARMLELVNFWSSANGYTPLTDKDVLRLAFDQLYTATKQLILKKEKAGEFDTKVVGEPGADSSNAATETVAASADSAPANDGLRGEGADESIEQAVSGS